MLREIVPRVVSWELGPEVGRQGQAGKPEVRGRSTVARYDGGTRPSEDSFDLEEPAAPRKPGNAGTEEKTPINLDEKAEFQKVDGDKQERPKTDEEIDKILKDPKSSSRLLDFLKRPFVR